MKNITKVILLNLVGLLAVFILYPFVHEMGHALAALAVGAQIVTVELFPIPFLLCQMDVNDGMSVICIGFGGILFPFLVTMVKPPRVFLLWYLWFVMKGICFLSFGISVWAILFYQTSLQIVDDDMTRVMQFVPNYRWEYCFVIVILVFVTGTQMICSKPKIRYIDYFG